MSFDIIDAHANFGTDANNLRKNLIPTEQTAFQLLEKMDSYKIAKAVIIPFPSPAAQFDPDAVWYQLENENLLNAAKKSDRFLAFPAVNPNSAGSVKNLKLLAGLEAVKGVKLSHQNIMKFSLESLIGHPVMKIIQDSGLAFLMHIGTGREANNNLYRMTLDYAIQVAVEYPDVNFIFAHLGRIHRDIEKALRMENVYMDAAGLSLKPWKTFLAVNFHRTLGSYSPAGIIEKLSDDFSDKILFGSDEPYTEYGNELRIIESAGIIDSEKREMLCGNISRLLKL